MLALNKIYLGDCLDLLPEIENDSIDLAITSPPYFVQKQYEKDWTLEKYENLMSNVFKQVHRVLKSGRYFVVNFGDYFNSGNRFYKADVPSVYPATIKYFQWGMENNFDLQATRIWRKQFAKMGIPFVCNKHPRNIFDYEHVWTFRKRNGSNLEFVNDRKLSQRGVLGETWTSKAGLKDHPAAFPIELPEWAISVYSKCESEVVLDPFMGSGQTAIACKNTGRNFIGIEKDENYFKLANERIGNL